MWVPVKGFEKYYMDRRNQGLGQCKRRIPCRHSKLQKYIKLLPWPQKECRRL